MKIITLKLRNQREWQFLQDLLRRLNINFEWEEEKKVSEKPPPNMEMIFLICLAVGCQTKQVMS